MKKMTPIEGYKIAPKAAIILVVIMIIPALLSLFKAELELAPIVAYICNSIAILAASAFVIPHAKIWHKSK